MKFFFPDSQDLVDPSFDFHTESRSETRVRQRDDQYPHEVFSSPPYDGMLVSKAIVDGTGPDAGSRYTMAQRHRLLRVGAREFFRLDGRPLEVLGDCGAFSYVREPAPPVTVTPLLPDQNRYNMSFGIGIPIVQGYELDGSYLHVFTEGRRGRIVERTDASQTAADLNSGFYELNADVLSVSLRIHF